MLSIQWYLAIFTVVMVRARVSVNKLRLVLFFHLFLILLLVHSASSFYSFLCSLALVANSVRPERASSKVYRVTYIQGILIRCAV